MLTDISPDMVPEEQAKVLLKFLRDKPEFSGDPTKLKELLPIGDYVKIMVLHYEELYQGIDLHELEYEVSHVRTKLINQYVKIQKQRIARELQTADDKSQTQLLEQAKKLDNLLKIHKGGA